MFVAYKLDTVFAPFSPHSPSNNILPWCKRPRRAGRDSLDDGVPVDLPTTTYLSTYR